MAQFFDRFSLGDMRGHFYKHIPGWKCEVIGILNNIQVDYCFRKFIEDEREDPVIGTDEIMTIVNDQCMRVLDRGFTADTQNMNGSFGKIFINMVFTLFGVILSNLIILV